MLVPRVVICNGPDKLNSTPWSGALGNGTEINGPTDSVSAHSFALFRRTLSPNTTPRTPLGNVQRCKVMLNAAAAQGSLSRLLSLRAASLCMQPST